MNEPVLTPRRVRAPPPSAPPAGANDFLGAGPVTPAPPATPAAGPGEDATGPAVPDLLAEARGTTRRTLDYRAVTTLFCAFVALEVVSAAVLFVMKLGVTPDAVAAAYVGTPMRAARSFSGLLEVALPHLLAIPLTVFTLVHLVAWLRPAAGARVRRLAASTFAVLAVLLVAGFGVRFVWPALSWLKLAGFVAFEGLMVGWVFAVMRAFTIPRAAR